MIKGGKKKEITIYLSNEHVMPRDSNELFLNLITQFDWVRGQRSFSLKNNNDLGSVSPPYLLFLRPAGSLNMMAH